MTPLAASPSLASISSLTQFKHSFWAALTLFSLSLSLSLSLFLSLSLYPPMAMEMASANDQENINAGPFTRSWHWLKALPGKLMAKVVGIAQLAKKIGQDDPRRITHSLKVGLAITLVSLFYYLQPLYNGFGVSASWAVLTVIVVFEFSVGATLGKGLNRMFATMVAGFLGIGAHRLACLSGGTAEPILIGLFVFLIAAVTTFVRFFPKVKARYDYGVMIFILTFCLICVSGYRNDEVVEMARQRLLTIIIGSCTSIIICIYICPVWEGQNFHNLLALNIEKIGTFLEGFGGEYLKTSEDGQSDNDKSILESYKSVLSPKTSEESVVNLARWEPSHGQFRFRHPWEQYLKIGTLTRECAYNIEALNRYLNSEIKTPAEVRSKIQEPCRKISSESGQALKELARAIKTMTQPSSMEYSHIKKSKTAVENLKALLQTGLWQGSDLLDIIAAATVASLLMDVVTCTEKISEAVQELVSLANFKSKSSVELEQPQLFHRGLVKPVSENDKPHDHVIIKVDESSTVFPENENPSSPTTGRQRME